MFAPVGYIPLYRVAKVLSKAARAAWVEELFRRRREEDFKDDIKFMEERQVLLAWMISRLFMKCDVYAASHDSNILLIDSWALSHLDEIGLEDWEWPGRERFSPCLASSLKRMRQGKSPLDAFAFVDCLSGVITLDREKMLLSEWDWRGGWPADIVGVMRPLKGWSVCFKREDIPVDQEELLLMINFDLPRYGAVAPATPRRGRPEKYLKVAEAYNSVFPNGHGALQRDEVRRSLEPIVGASFHLETLDKAIRTIKSGKSG